VNIGTGRETSVNDLYRRLATALGVGQRAEHGPATHGEQRRSALDASRAAQWLGWTPSTGLDEGLRRTLSHCERVAGNDAGAALAGR
jgi:UDP-glucose 4-epimerase